MSKKERQESTNKGTIAFKSYLAYFTAGTGYFGLIALVLIFLMAQGLVVYANYWLSIWYLI